MADIRRIGILTSGGDCAGLNAVLRAVTHRAVVVTRRDSCPGRRSRTGEVASPHFSPEHEARACRCPEIQGARVTKCAGVLYGTSSPLSECNAVGLGRCAPAAVGW